MLDLIAPKFAYRATNDYGCAARGSLDPFVSNAGKPVDEIDRAINNWKYCIRCAMDVLTEGNDPALPKYKFDADKRICRKKFKYNINQSRQGRDKSPPPILKIALKNHFTSIASD